MRIAAVTDLHIANSMYRALPLLELAGRGHEVRVEDGNGLDAAPLLGCDVVHVYRYHDAHVRKVVQRLRDAGVAIVWDNDDDMSGGPRESQKLVAKGAMRAQRFQAGMMQMVALADLVTTSSDALAEQYRRWGAERVRVIENYLPRCYAADPPRRSAGVTVGWTAFGEHEYDMEALGIRATLARLLERHPDLTVVSIGIDLKLGSDRYRRHPLVQYPELASRVATFDVGIAPIADIPFNRARSNVKVKEYAAAGLPWLASPIGPYAGLGEREGGRLVADDRWFQELDRLIRDERARRKLAKRGLKWAAGQRAERNAGQWERALAEAVERASERTEGVGDAHRVRLRA